MQRSTQLFSILHKK